MLQQSSLGCSAADREPSQSRPRLLALEGPAGVGKTTLFNILIEDETLSNGQIGIVDEFSTTPLGEALKTNHANPHQERWGLSLGGMLAYLADKTFLLEKAISTNPELVICDRFVSTQMILGLHGINDKKSLGTGNALIQQIEAWVLQKFAYNSLVVVLTAAPHVLKQRLEQRLDRRLNNEEIQRITWESQGYDTFPRVVHTNCVFVPANDSPEHIAKRVKDAFLNTPKD